MSRSPRVVALVGPTAAGKSAMALEAARRAGTEIVAVDAFTVYRGMDVGTAKPSAAQRAAVPHHAIDLLEPEQECSVAWFQGAGRAAVDGVTSRGLVPLLVGGSGLYFRAVVDDLEFPPTDAELRARIAGELDAAAAHVRLAALDPEAAARIDPGNLRRSVRALEVLALTGRRFSDWRRGWGDYRSRRADLTVIGVDVDRAALADRVRARTEAMLAGGLLEECRALSGRALSRSARQAIGYAEGLDVVVGGLDAADASERIAARTRRYAARQQRWFAADPRVRWCAPGAVADALAAALRPVPGAPPRKDQ